MSRRGRAEIQPWMLFAFPAAIAVPILAGILLGGPVVGVPVAALVALVVVAVAIRMEPRGQRLVARRAEPPSRDGAAPGEPRAEPDLQWRKAAARRFLLPLVIAVAGIALAVAAGGTLEIIGWGVVAVALVVAVSLFFLEVGYSEDRARARERRGTRASTPMPRSYRPRR